MVISSPGTSHEDALRGSCTASQVAKLTCGTWQSRSSPLAPGRCNVILKPRQGKRLGEIPSKCPHHCCVHGKITHCSFLLFSSFYFPSINFLSFFFFKVGSSLRKDFLKLTYKVMGFIMKCPRTLFDFPPLVGSLSYSRTTLPPFKSRVLYCPFFSSSSLRSRFLLSWYPF